MTHDVLHRGGSLPVFRGTRTQRSTDEYTDLSQSLLHLQAKVVNGDGTPLDEDAQVAPANLLMHTLFNLFQVVVPALVEVNKEFEATFWTNFSSHPDIVCSWDFHDNVTTVTNSTQLQQPIVHSYTAGGVYEIFTFCHTAETAEGLFSEVLVYSDVHFDICLMRSTNASYAYDTFVRGAHDIFVHYWHDYEDPIFYYVELDGNPVFEIGFSYGPLVNDELYAIQMDSILFPIELQNTIDLGNHNLSVTVYSEFNSSANYCEAEIKFVELISGVIFWISEYYVEPNAPFLATITAERGWPALIEWRAQNADDNTVDFFFDTFREARGIYESDNIWLYISKPGLYPRVL
ncbi:uncharacterized protein [Diadema setosum]|uniref:uncharacterized protein n=1 Tax=Diadema setosum TaxID=31175 RepID=UPI003B3B7DFB